MIALVMGRQHKLGLCRMFLNVGVEERDSQHIDVSDFQRALKE